jgi:hypothetical protein
VLAQEGRSSDFYIADNVIVGRNPADRFNLESGGAWGRTRAGYAVNLAGYCATLSGDPHDTNSLEEPTRIVPAKGEFEAGSSFVYEFPAYFITVLRVNPTKPPKRP